MIFNAKSRYWYIISSLKQYSKLTCIWSNFFITTTLSATTLSKKLEIHQLFWGFWKRIEGEGINRKPVFEKKNINQILQHFHHQKMHLHVIFFLLKRQINVGFKHRTHRNAWVLTDWAMQLPVINMHGVSCKLNK